MITLTPEMLQRFGNVKRAAGLTEQAINLFNNGELVHALSTFDKALKINPKSLIALQYRAKCKNMLSKSDDITAIEKVNYIYGKIRDLEKVEELLKVAHGALKKLSHI